MRNQTKPRESRIVEPFGLSAIACISSSMVRWYWPRPYIDIAAAIKGVGAVQRVEIVRLEFRRAAGDPVGGGPGVAGQRARSPSSAADTDRTSKPPNIIASAKGSILVMYC